MSLCADTNVLLRTPEALWIGLRHVSLAAGRRAPLLLHGASGNPSFTSVILPTTISPTSPLYLGARQREQPVKRLILPTKRPSQRPSASPHAARTAGFTLPARRRRRPRSPGLQRFDAHQLVHPLHGAGHRGDELLLVHVGAVAPVERATA